MDRNQAKEFYPILQAYAEGKVIECRTKPSFIEGTDVPNDWAEMREIVFWNNTIPSSSFTLFIEDTIRQIAHNAIHASVRNTFHSFEAVFVIYLI